MKKRTTQREAIVKVLISASSHPSAEWIHEQVRQEMPGIGLATVYRNLRLLRNKGKVVALRSSDGTTRYDGNTSFHYHFTCDRCGHIIDIGLPTDASLQDRISRDTGLKVTGLVLMATGLCVECQQLEAIESQIQPGLEEVLIMEYGSGSAMQEPSSDASD